MLKPKDVAAHLNVSKATIERLIKSGDIIAVKVGTSWRIAHDDLTNYLSKRSTAK